MLVYLYLYNTSWGGSSGFMYYGMVKQTLPIMLGKVLVEWGNAPNIMGKSEAILV
jgi:hypothetical protein